MRVLLLAMSLVLMAGSASANDTVSQADAAAKEAGKDKVVCRRERPTGSRIATKVCMTKGEWEVMSEASRNSLDNATTPPTSNGPSARKPSF